MSFDRPLALLSLAVLAALAAGFVVARTSQAAVRRPLSPNVDVLRGVAPRVRAAVRRHAAARSFTAALALLCVASPGRT